MTLQLAFGPQGALGGQSRELSEGDAIRQRLTAGRGTGALRRTPPPAAYTPEPGGARPPQPCEPRPAPTA